MQALLPLLLITLRSRRNYERSQRTQAAGPASGGGKAPLTQRQPSPADLASCFSPTATAMAAVAASGAALERAFRDKNFKLEAAVLPRVLQLAQTLHLTAEGIANQYETLALVK